MLGRLRRPRAEITDDAWQWLGGTVPLVARYAARRGERLRALTGEFLARKDVRGAAGLELDHSTRLVVAATACVPVLELGLEWYRGWITVAVYPGPFVARHEFTDEDGVHHDVERPLSGEAWDRGPVVLSWDDIEADLEDDWGNVIVHECAHKLDLVDGVANGLPPLHPEMRRRVWANAFSAAYDDFVARVEHDRDVPFDDCAADDPGEFFAVASETFFVRPLDVEASYPAVFEQLCAFYRQDPR